MNWRYMVMAVTGMVSGMLITVGILSTRPGDVIVSDTVGVEDTVYSVDSSFKYSGLKCRQENGKLILELEYTKRGGDDAVRD